MHPQQQERLKRMINSSQMLTSKEKEEWLDLLIVMNDKQVSELEAILATPAEQTAPAATPPRTAAPAQAPIQPTPAPQAVPPSAPNPPLSHISNLPSSLPQRRYPLPKSPKPTGLTQWQNRLRHTLEEKELSGRKDEKALPARHEAKQAPVVYPSPKPSAPPQPAPVRPTHSRPPAPQPSQPELRESVIKIVEPADIAKLNVTTMREMGENLVPTLKQMVANSNYFEVLFFLEKSPLYRAYLDTGHLALDNPGAAFPATANGKILLAKAEFEEFSDLLKSIQFA